jgi:hypothetical protein
LHQRPGPDQQGVDQRDVLTGLDDGVGELIELDEGVVLAEEVRVGPVPHGEHTGEHEEQDGGPPCRVQRDDEDQPDDDADLGSQQGDPAHPDCLHPGLQPLHGRHYSGDREQRHKGVHGDGCGKNDPGHRAGALDGWEDLEHDACRSSGCGGLGDVEGQFVRRRLTVQPELLDQHGRRAHHHHEHGRREVEADDQRDLDQPERYPVSTDLHVTQSYAEHDEERQSQQSGQPLVGPARMTDSQDHTEHDGQHRQGSGDQPDVLRGPTRWRRTPRHRTPLPVDELHT